MIAKYRKTHFFLWLVLAIVLITLAILGYLWIPKY